MVKSAEVLDRIKARWDFSDERRETVELNERFRLNDPYRFDASLRPVFFVGDLEGDAEFLAVGLKPGRNLDSNRAFAAEVAAISGDLQTYVGSRTRYFVSDGFNSRHYRPLAGRIAELRNELLPEDVGEYLQRSVVQAELLPFFAPRSGLSDSQFLQARASTSAGRLADQTLTALLSLRPWKAIITRYSMTGRLFRRLYCPSGEAYFLAADGRRIPVVEINGQGGGQNRPRKSRTRADLTYAELGLLDESVIGVSWVHGRKWAVSQAFAAGGTVDEILARAEHFNVVRCQELGHEPERDVWGDRAHLRSEQDYYPRRFRELGWSVCLADGLWSVVPPKKRTELN